MQKTFDLGEGQSITLDDDEPGKVAITFVVMGAAARIVVTAVATEELGTALVAFSLNIQSGSNPRALKAVSAATAGKIASMSVEEASKLKP